MFRIFFLNFLKCSWRICLEIFHNVPLELFKMFMNIQKVSEQVCKHFKVWSELFKFNLHKNQCNTLQLRHLRCTDTHHYKRTYANPIFMSIFEDWTANPWEWQSDHRRLAVNGVSRSIESTTPLNYRIHRNSNSEPKVLPSLL